MVSRRKFLGFTGLAAAWPNAAWAQDEKAKAKPKPKPEGVVVNDVHAQLNSTRAYRIVEPQSIDAVRAAMKLARTEKRALCIAGGRHAMGTQQFATDGVLLDIRKMNQVLAFDTERGLIEMESGMQWPQLLEHLAAARFSGEKQWAFNQKQTGADRMTMGGCLAANIHGRGLTLPPFISDVESFTLVDAKGELRPCSRTENAELFRLAIGGYGLFGFVYSVTLRLVPRRQLQRVAALRRPRPRDQRAALLVRRAADEHLSRELPPRPRQAAADGVPRHRRDRRDSLRARRAAGVHGRGRPQCAPREDGDHLRRGAADRAGQGELPRLGDEALRLRRLQPAHRARLARPDPRRRPVPPPDRPGHQVRRQLVPDVSPARAAPPGRRLLPAACRLPQAQAQVRPGRAVPERLVPALQ